MFYARANHFPNSISSSVIPYHIVASGMEFGTFYRLSCSLDQSPLQRYEETLIRIRHADSMGVDIAWLAELHFSPTFSNALALAGGQPVGGTNPSYSPRHDNEVALMAPVYVSMFTSKPHGHPEASITNCFCILRDRYDTPQAKALAAHSPRMQEMQTRLQTMTYEHMPG